VHEKYYQTLSEAAHEDLILQMIKVWAVRSCRCEHTVGVGLWGIYTEDLAAKSNSVCPDGINYDICKSTKAVILSIYMKFVREVF
jgi:hypothetical protein